MKKTELGKASKQLHEDRIINREKDKIASWGGKIGRLGVVSGYTTLNIPFSTTSINTPPQIFVKKKKGTFYEKKKRENRKKEWKKSVENAEKFFFPPL